MDILEYIKQVNDMYDEDVITTADKIKRPDPKPIVKEIEAINEFMKRNPFGGGGFVFKGIRALYKGKKGLQTGRIEKELMRKYRDEGMELIDAVTTANREAYEIVDNRKLDIVQDAMTKVDIRSDDYIRLMDEQIRLTDYELYTDIKRWDEYRPDLSAKSRARHDPYWAESNFGENYDEVLLSNQAKALKAQSDEIDRMYPTDDPDVGPSFVGEAQTVKEIDEMNKANIAELFEGKKKHAIGGRVGYDDGGIIGKPGGIVEPGVMYYGKNVMSGSPAQQAENIRRAKERFDRIGKAFIKQDYKKLKVKTKTSRIKKGAVDAGGILNTQDTTLLNDVIFGNDVKKQNELAKKLGVNRKYMIDTYTDALEFTKKGKSKKISELALKKLETQKNLFDEILNNPDATVKSMAKKFKINEKQVVKQSSLLLKNVYAQNVAISKENLSKEPLKSWLPDDYKITDDFLDNFSNIKGLRKVQSENIGTLIRDAFGKGKDPKKYVAALEGLNEYNKLVNLLPEGVKLDLDHPLSKAFLKGSNVSPEKLLYVTPISREYNRGFKEKLSKAYDNALLSPKKDKKLIKTIENFANKIGVNIGKGSTKKFDFGTTNIAKKTQSGLAEELVKNFREQNLARKNLAKFKKTEEGKNILKTIFPKGRKLEIPKAPLAAIVNKLVKSGFRCGAQEGLTCKDPKAYTKSVMETMELAKQGDNAAVAKINKMGKLMKGFKGAAKWTGWGILTEIGFAAPLAAVNYAKGANKDEIISNITYGLAGKSIDEQLKEKYEGYGQAQKLFDLYDKAQRSEELTREQGGYRSLFTNLQREEDAYKAAEKAMDPFMIPTPHLEEGRYFDENKVFTDLARDESRLSDYMTEREKIGQERMEKMQPVQFYTGAKYGGLIGDKSGPAPESGPMSRGLRSLYNNGRKL